MHSGYQKVATSCCEEQAAQEIPELPVGAKSDGDSVGYATVVAKELDQEAITLMVP